MMSGRLKKHQGLMKKSISHLGISELHCASSYLEKIFTVITDFAEITGDKEIRSTCSLLNYEIKSFIRYNLLQSKEATPAIEACYVSCARNNVKNASRVLESLLALEICGDIDCLKNLCDFINILFKHGNVLHKIVAKHSDFEIQLPRVILAAPISDEVEIPQFYLDYEKLINFFNDNESIGIKSLQWQREKKYEKLVQQGHEFISDKEFHLALESFEKARNYYETAEVLNLIGWTYGLQEEKEKAKSYCLKAIKKDPNYGPPYNDLGSYLLGEGQVDESIKWFELAKKALNYQNREYPYINCGRAYMAKRDIPNALEEFGKALTLAPYHEELHQTVKRLKRTLEKASLQDIPQEEAPPPLF